ncbi:PepSY-associated TM helix domain-containing protein [Noviherbaspirillum aerium]|uniref:PepSY-associated TM helix domain-containing protein n=1 Tax=Noviherbaspirillum aerium TaxID=2588497 RepID=UPI00124C7462|nr:PepSY-associated TM helix domain-containing protein [Noviherbaspirillum aerium]
MEPTFRKSMEWLHTWAGVIIGSVLFAIFWMGSLSVFDREIDRWMMPATRLGAPPPASLDTMVKPVAEQLSVGSPQWFVSLPNDRMPVFRVGYRDASGGFARRYIDPANGDLLPDAGTHGGTGFIFPFHYSLHIKWMDLGYWLVGLAGMGMLVLLVSGVIIHRKIFREFFTFRPQKQVQRASLDLHNLTGVLALPFHFAITLSGLIIFYAIYFPWPATLPFQGNKEALQAEAFGGFNRPKTGVPGRLASLDAMVRDAEARWSVHHGAPVSADFVRVVHPGDAASFVQVRSVFPSDTVAMDRGVAVYDAGSGTLIREHYSAPVRSVHAFIAGMHFIQFQHWTLRWLYFLGGMAGCVMIATGFLFWQGSRRARHAQQGLAGAPLVQGLTIGSVTGIIIATFAFFAVNRLLPANAEFAGAGRAAFEMSAFYLVWCGTFAHAWLRPARAWCEQALAIAALAVLAVSLNWLSTGDHLLKTLAAGSAGVAGMDLMLLTAAALAALAARRLGRRHAVPARHTDRRTRDRNARGVAAVKASQQARHD